MGPLARKGEVMDPKHVTDASAASIETTDSDKGGKFEPVIAHDRTIEPPSYDWLGPSLRRLYHDVLKEPVPESFVELLKQLHDQQKRRSD